MAKGASVSFPTIRVNSLEKAGLRIPRKMSDSRGEGFLMLEIVATSPLGIVNPITESRSTCDLAGIYDHSNG